MEFLTLIGLGILGILFHILMKFRDGITKEPKNGRKFKERFHAVWAKFDLLESLAYAVFALFVVMLLVVLRDKFNDIGFPVTAMTIPFYGYAADSAFKNLKPEKIK